MENYWFEFKYVECDKKWVSYVCVDRQTEDCDINEHITGKELRKFIEDNFMGDNFDEKRSNFWKIENIHFREYAHKNGIFLVSDMIRNIEPDFNYHDDIREIDIQNLPVSILTSIITKRGL